MIDSMRTTPIAPTLAAELESPNGALHDGAARSLLPTPIASVNAGHAMAMLQIEDAFERRKSARDLRSSAENGTRAAQEAELSSLRDKADAEFAAAQVKAWTQIVSGAAGILGASANALGDAMRNAPIASIGKFTREAMTSGGADVLKGTGESVSAFLQRGAADDEMSAKRSANTADALKKIAEEAHDDDRAAKESVRRSLDFLTEYETSSSQSRAAALYKV